MKNLILILIATVLSSCGGGGGGGETVQVGFVDLRVSPIAFDNMSFSESDTGTQYSEASRTRKIISEGATMTFSFSGKKEFRLIALGSTIQGVSHSYINIYVNSQLHREAVYLVDPAEINIISSSEFTDGANRVTIELVRGPGETLLSHAWIYEATVFE